MTALIRLPAVPPELSSTYRNDSEFERTSTELSPLQAALRHRWGILLFALSATALASFFLKQLPVRYTASTSIMLDTRKMQVIDAQSVLSNPLLTPEQLRTYVEQLQSPALAQAVVKQLNLIHEPEYCSPATSIWAELETRFATLLNRSVAPPPPATVCDTSVDDATEHLLGAVSGSNDGRSYTLKIAADSATPELAAKIANAYAHAYLETQRRQTTDAAEQADAWLTNYLGSIRTKMQAADSAVEVYQRQNQLIPVKGETVVSQRLSELNSQLTVATGELAEKQSQLRQAQSLGSRGGQIDASAPVLASPVIQRLVDRETELQASRADLRSRYGDSYPAVQAATAQLSKVQQSLRNEVSKVILGLESEVGALSARTAALTSNVQSLQTATGRQGTANIQLQELQRDADTEHHLYEVMLTRLHEVDAERHMQWHDSDLVIEARPPHSPSFPRTNMILAGISMVALGVGAALAFALTLLSPVFRDIDQVEGETGARVLGLFPRPSRRGAAPKNIVVDHPYSPEAETVVFTLANLIGARAELKDSGGWVVMVTSAVPGEGKSSFSVALGHAAIQAGLSVALLQCDLRTQDQSKFAVKKVGLAQPDAAVSTEGLKSLSAVDKSHLHILPIRSILRDAQRLAASPELSAVLQALRSQYSLVLIDTPPVLAVSDALSLARVIDDTVLLVDWKKARRRSVAATIRVMLRANIKITGIVLSKVNLRQFARLSRSEGFYARAYKGYRLAFGSMSR